VKTVWSVRIAGGISLNTSEQKSWWNPTNLLKSKTHQNTTWTYFLKLTSDFSRLLLSCYFQKEGIHDNPPFHPLEDQASKVERQGTAVGSSMFCFKTWGVWQNSATLTLTYPLKMVVFNRNLLFQGSILRGYVSFREATSNWNLFLKDLVGCRTWRPPFDIRIWWWRWRWWYWYSMIYHQIHIQDTYSWTLWCHIVGGFITMQLNSLAPTSGPYILSMECFLLADLAAISLIGVILQKNRQLISGWYLPPWKRFNQLLGCFLPASVHVMEVCCSCK